MKERIIRAMRVQESKLLSIYTRVARKRELHNVRLYITYPKEKI